MTNQDIRAALGNGHLDRVKMRLREPRDAVAVRSALKITERLLREINSGSSIVVVKRDGSTRELRLSRSGRPA